MNKTESAAMDNRISNSGPMGIYLEHANITVKSIDRAIDFLAVVFPDFRRRGEGDMFGDPDLGRWVHFGNDDTYIALQEMQRGVDIQSRSYEEVGVNHLGFVVDDMDTLIERLAQAGYQPTDASDIGSHPYRHRAYFKDDCGFEWEFVQYLSETPSERNDYSL